MIYKKNGNINEKDPKDTYCKIKGIKCHFFEK